jgi:hypothetical protein
MSSISRTWGTTAADRALVYPCDRHLDRVDDAFYRGISIAAPPAIIFRWLCQLRVAPYSYDWLDNFGRTSPQTLTPGLERLAIGQSFMLLFELVEFEVERHLTTRARRSAAGGGIAARAAVALTSARLVPDIVVSFVIAPEDATRARLLVKQAFQGPAGLYGRLFREALAWGDLVMQRRQLLNLCRLAEATARGAGRS